MSSFWGDICYKEHGKSVKDKAENMMQRLIQCLIRAYCGILAYCGCGRVIKKAACDLGFF